MTIRQSVTRLGQMTAGRKSGRCGTFLKLETDNIGEEILHQFIN